MKRLFDYFVSVGIIIYTPIDNRQTSAMIYT